MALSDFLFFGNGGDDEDAGPAQALHDMGIANGGSGLNVTTCGKGAIGAAITNSSLSNPLSSSVASSNCRGFMWKEGATQTTSWPISAAASGYVAAAAGGSKYPTNNIGGSESYSYSCRAFLRLGTGYGNADYFGTNIGLFHKGYHADGTTQYSGALGPGLSGILGNSEDAPDAPYESYSNGGIHSGYQVILSSHDIYNYDNTTKHTSNGGSAGRAGGTIKLVIVAPEVDDRMDSTDNQGDSTACTGTYALDTWYHVRFDVYPNGGNDVLKAYTAPTGDTIGSETWTLVGTHTVSAAAASRISWTDSNRKYSGYFSTAGRNYTADLKCGNAYIDRFQFLTKDIS